MLGLLVMGIVGGFLAQMHARKEYNEGFMDAVQLHSEGRLTYTTEQEEGVALLTIEVTDE